MGTALTLLALLSGCGPQGLRVGDQGPYAPSGVPRGEASVDGLIVGHRLMAAGEFELALKAYQRSASEHGLTVDVLSAIGSADLHLGRLGQAEKILRRAIEVDESFVPAWNNLGVVLVEKGDYAEAARVFKVAFGLDSGNSTIIRDNLRLALAKIENPAYDEPTKSSFALMRRGAGDYLLLSNY